MNPTHKGFVVVETFFCGFLKITMVYCNNKNWITLVSVNHGKLSFEESVDNDHLEQSQSTFALNASFLNP